MIHNKYLFVADSSSFIVLMSWYDKIQLLQCANNVEHIDRLILECLNQSIQAFFLRLITRKNYDQ